MIEVHEAVHVRIAKPITYRKKILESAIDTTRLLQKFEYFKAVRDKKEFYKKQLKTTINEINNLINDLEIKELPETKSIKEKSTIKDKIQGISSIKEKPSSAMDKLDKDLMSIQDKLKNLEI